MITPRTPLAPRAVGAHYDTLDRWYREIWGEHVHHGLWDDGVRHPPEYAARRLTDHIAGAARVTKGDRVVDLGCGYGATSRILARERGADVVGFTLSEAQAAYARAITRELGDGDVEYRVQDWLDNDLPDGSVDVVIAIESLSHVSDKARAFAQIARVLKPGTGRLVLTDWLARSERSSWRDDLLLEPICREGRLPSMHTPAEYAAFMMDAGLTRGLAFADLSREVSRTWPIILRRTARRIATDHEARAFLLSKDNPDRIFALTMLRIHAAYVTRAMVYGTFYVSA